MSTTAAEATHGGTAGGGMADDQLITRAHLGAQERFLSTKADIAIYGGAAGSGKSAALLLESIRCIGNPLFGCVIFRRSYPQIFNVGGLWDTSKKIYPVMGGFPRAGDAEWVFPSGAKIKFAHMEHENSKKDWDGSQIPLICFDELTSFTSSMFWYMLSRNRSTSGVRPYMRATCNPDADSWVAELIAWWIDQETGYPIPERSGVLRWFIRDAGKIVWFDSRIEAARYAVKHLKVKPEAAAKMPKSLTFVPGRLDDNPTLEAIDPGYRATLMALEFVERERLLGGNWKIRPAAGLKFPRDKWKRVPAAPAGLRLVRYWDKAYTEGGKGARTAGVLIGEMDSDTCRKLQMPKYWILHGKAGRWGDAERESIIRNTAVEDHAKYKQLATGLEMEGGAGKHSAHMTVANLAGFNVFTEKPVAKKHIRWSPLATQQQIGQVAIVTEGWDFAEFINELDSLAGDEKLDKGKLRDYADAAAGGFKYLAGDTGMRIEGDLIASGDPEDEIGLYDEDEREELPDFLRDLIDETDAAAKDRGKETRWRFGDDD